MQEPRNSCIIQHDGVNRGCQQRGWNSDCHQLPSITTMHIFGSVCPTTRLGTSAPSDEAWAKNQSRDTLSRMAPGRFMDIHGV